MVANGVQGPDGRWTALDGRDLYRHRLAADAIYRASYQRQLSRTLGVEWTAADAYGNRELEGLPEDLVRLDSKRTDRIDLEVERLEASGRERTPRLVKWAVHATRKPKDHQAADTLYGRWRTEAAEQGHDPDTLLRQVTGRTGDRDQVLSERTVAAVFERLADRDARQRSAESLRRWPRPSAMRRPRQRIPLHRSRAQLLRSQGRTRPPRRAISFLVRVRYEDYPNSAQPSTPSPGRASGDL